VTYKELFKDLIYGRIPDAPLDNWDNRAEGIEVPDCPSLEQCISECEQNKGCFQALYDGKDCTLGTRHFMLGVKREPAKGKTWQSYWNKLRMYEFAKKHQDCSNANLAFKDHFVCR
jgi:hypothetical protein